MSYRPKRQIKESSGINWGVVTLAALITFALSVLFGRWLGGELISSRNGITPPAEKENYTSPGISLSTQPPLPNQTELPRENVTSSPLQIPPPVAETAPPGTENELEDQEDESESEYTPKASPAQIMSPDLTGPYRVQAGAFTQKKDAEDLQKELSQDGYNSTLIATSQKGTTYYQVFLGPYQDQNMARSMAHELSLLGYQPLVLGDTSKSQQRTLSPTSQSSPSPTPTPSPQSSPKKD